MQIALGVLLVVVGSASEATAWGCDGHRAVVYIAERLLPPATITIVRSVLAAAPIDPSLRRFCQPLADDPIADASTWADDYRDVDATTFGWHFIDVPRNRRLTVSNEPSYCHGGNCVVEAILAQYRVLSGSADVVGKANALRFLLHFIGDLHQPLHAATNGDRGGNCVPVTYYDRAPEQNPNGDYSPNLHGVWDSSAIRTLMTSRGLQDARALADFIVAQRNLPSSVGAVAPTRAIVTRWAQESHALAETVVYPRLSTPVAVEPPSAAFLSSCADNHNIAQRMLAKREVIDGRYERWSVPVIVDQLRLAGLRLASVLKAAFR
jgi:hypothetical protein